MSSAVITEGAGSGVKSTPTNALPALREELNLFPGTDTLNGEPTWILQDPVAHRFYQIGRLEFEILSRWNLGNLESLLNDLNRSNATRVEAAKVEEVADFLAKHNLLQSRGMAALQRLNDHAARMAVRDFTWLIKNYLFIRIPLLNPDRLLGGILRSLSVLNSRAFFRITLMAGLLGLFLVQRQWEEFLNSFPYFFSQTGVLIMVATLILVKVLHEFGHALTAKHFGCRVPSMGVAFLVLWPVLYTDASDVWRLSSRRQRLLVSAAGMMTELAIAAYAILIWNFLEDGPIRSAVFLLATTTWVVSLLVNLNPFMRFDGYYLAADLTGVANLQERSFALARWKLREFLFGFQDRVPEKFPAKTERLLLGYAFLTWIYRFFLFLGIALLVYHFFFKLLGIFLLLVELGWFIGKPVVEEMRSWLEYRGRYSWNGASLRTAFLVGLLGVWLLFPWKQDISAPAVWRAGEFSYLYAPDSARVKEVSVRQGQVVQAGQTLIQLDSPDLDYAITQGDFELAALRWQLENQGFNPELQERARVAYEEYEVEMARQRARVAERDTFLIQSPIDGLVRELVEPLAAGDWIRDGTFLASIVAPNSGRVEAWIDEAELGQVSEGATGIFYPDDIGLPQFRFDVLRIDEGSTRQLTDLYQASLYGGDIATRQNRSGDLIPVRPVYHLTAVSEDLPVPQQVLRGTVRLSAERKSVISKLWQNFVTVLISESSF